MSVQKVSDLPLEDTIWLMSIQHTEDENGDQVGSVAIHNSRHVCVGQQMLPQAEADISRLCQDLVYTCCLSPPSGKPRRPKCVMFTDLYLARQTRDLDLSNVGIRCLCAGQPGLEDWPRVSMRECSVCRTRGSKDLFDTCPGCGCLLYCCPACREADWSREGNQQALSHKLWCETFKGYMAKAEQLRQLPFTFAAETTSEKFDQVAYRRFLEGEGVYDLGYWKRETTAGGLSSYGELWEVEDGAVLPSESVILDQPPDNPPAGPIASWQLYYEYRGFRLDSPIAILLQWPLTLYYVVSSCLNRHYPSSLNNLPDNTLNIDIIGVEQEVELLPLFLEAGYLLMDYTLNIHMFGAEIPKTVHKKQWRSGNVSIHIFRSLYHKTKDKERKPHLVLGYNAGLGAYGSWTKTLLMLKENRTPSYFTDYCQYSCQCARTAVETLGVGTTSDPALNPFRSPVRKLADENNFPWYSNGFIYHISYPP